MRLRRIRALAGLAALAMASGAIAQPAPNPPPARRNVSGPTVEQIHAYRPRNPAMTVVRGPLQRGGRAPYWFTIGDGATVVFDRCGSDGRCDYAVIFTSLGRLPAAKIEQIERTIGGCLVGALGHRHPICLDGDFENILRRAGFVAADEIAMFEPARLGNRSDPGTIDWKAPGLLESANRARAAVSGR